MQHLSRLLSALSLCVLTINISHALDFSGSTVISSDVNDGLNAVGGVVGDTLLIKAGAKVINGLNLNIFPFEVINNGKIAPYLDYENTGKIINNGDIYSHDATSIIFLDKGEVVNYGTISGGVFSSIELLGGGKIINQGQILVQSSSWIRIENGGTVINKGSITNVDAINPGNIFFAHGGDVVNSGNLTNQVVNIFGGGTIVNSGAITSGDNNNSINLYGGGIIRNSGAIFGDQIGVWLEGGGEIINTGTISGRFIGFYASSVVNGDAETVINSGSIIGNRGIAIITLDGDDTVILQTGSNVEGDIDGGSDNDKAVLQGTGVFNNNFKNIENLTMEGIDWNLTGNSNFYDTRITHGLLRINGTHTRGCCHFIAIPLKIDYRILFD